MRPEQPLDHRAQFAHLVLDAGEALHQRHIAERVGGALGEVRVIALDRFLHGLGLAQHEHGEREEDERQSDEQEAEPPVEIERERQQHGDRHDGREMLAEEAEP